MIDLHPEIRQTPFFARLPPIKTGWVTAALAALAILLIRIVLAAHVHTCGAQDPCSYFALAQSLGNGHSFVQNFIETYQIPNPHLPLTGLEYWRPGPAFVLLLARPFGGVTLFSALVVTILMGFALAGAAYYTAMNMTGDATTAMFAFLLCLSLPPVWQYSASPDSPLCYGACIAWFLALIGLESHSFQRDLAAIGVAMAASFMRNDAPLLLFSSLLVVLFLRLKRTPQEQKMRATSYAACLVGAFLVAMTPEMLLSHAVVGSSLRGATWRMLFLNDLGDFAAYRPLTFHGWLKIGIKGLLMARVKTLATIAHQAVSTSIGFAGIFIVGCYGWKRTKGRRESIAAFCTMLVACAAAYGIVFPAVGERAMLRTMVGLLPFAATLIAVGILRIARTTAWATALLWGCISFYALTGVFDVVHTARASVFEARAYERISSLIAHSGGPGTVMTQHPAELSAATGLSAIPIPSDGPDAVRDAARVFHVKYVVAATADEARWVALDLHAEVVAQIPGSQLVLLKIEDGDQHD